MHPFKTYLSTFVIASTLATSSVTARENKWAFIENDQTISVADCTDCEEDIGILMTCNSSTKPIKITLYALAGETANRQSSDLLTSKTDTSQRKYAVEIIEYGLVGFVPVLNISSDDPLLTDLADSHQINFSFLEAKQTIGLKGSKVVLSKFKNKCSSLKNPTDTSSIEFSPPQLSQTILTYSQPEMDEDGLFWFTGNGSGEGSPKTLNYAIPETDAAVLSATCQKEGNSDIVLELFNNNGSKNTGAGVTLSIQHQEGQSSFQGKVFSENEEYAGSRYFIMPEHMIWKHIIKSEEISLLVDGKPHQTLNVKNGIYAISEFHTACS